VAGFFTALRLFSRAYRRDGKRRKKGKKESPEEGFVCDVLVDLEQIPTREGKEEEKKKGRGLGKKKEIVAY